MSAHGRTSRVCSKATLLFISLLALLAPVSTLQGAGLQAKGEGRGCNQLHQPFQRLCKSNTAVHLNSEASKQHCKVLLCRQVEREEAATNYVSPWQRFKRLFRSKRAAQPTSGASTPSTGRSSPMQQPADDIETGTAGSDLRTHASDTLAAPWQQRLVLMSQ